MSNFLHTFQQAGVAIRQLADGSAFKRHVEVDTPLSDEFKALIESDVKPLLAPLEAFRLEKLATKTRNKKWALRLGWILWLPALIWDLLYLASGDLHISVLFVVAGLAIWVIYPGMQYRKHYKQMLMPVLVKAFGDFRYDEKGCIDIDGVQALDTMPSFSSKSHEDHISGKVEDIEFEFCELKLERKGHKSSTTVFRGGAVILKLPFQLSGHTVVGMDYGKLGNMFAASMARRKVALENPEFEERFEVSSTDQQYARYLLSPAMMERLLALDDLFRTRAKGSGLSCEFKGNQVLLMISYFGDLLDTADLSVSAYDLDKLPLLEQELAMITGLIKQLKLDYLVARNQAVDRYSSSV